MPYSLFSKADPRLQYWNWFYKPDDPYTNPLFDGSDTSMGSDGAYMEHNGTLASQGNLFVPSGKGGGCVKSGPLKSTLSLPKFIHKYIHTNAFKAWNCTSVL